MPEGINYTVQCLGCLRFYAATHCFDLRCPHCSRSWDQHISSVNYVRMVADEVLFCNQMTEMQDVFDSPAYAQLVLDDDSLGFPSLPFYHLPDMALMRENAEGGRIIHMVEWESATEHAHMFSHIFECIEELLVIIGDEFPRAAVDELRAYARWALFFLDQEAYHLNPYNAARAQYAETFGLTIYTTMEQLDEFAETMAQHDYGYTVDSPTDSPWEYVRSIRYKLPPLAALRDEPGEYRYWVYMSGSYVSETSEDYLEMYRVSAEMLRRMARNPDVISRPYDEEALNARALLYQMAVAMEIRLHA